MVVDFDRERALRFGKYGVESRTREGGLKENEGLLRSFCRFQYGGRSSVGRAQGCGPWGRGFEPRRSP
jgi:hypothetical protein